MAEVVHVIVKGGASVVALVEEAVVALPTQGVSLLLGLLCCKLLEVVSVLKSQQAQIVIELLRILTYSGEHFLIYLRVAGKLRLWKESGLFHNNWSRALRLCCDLDFVLGLRYVWNLLPYLAFFRLLLLYSRASLTKIDRNL